MKFHFGRKDLISWVFLILAIAATINLVTSGRDYFLLYASRANVQFTIAKMAYQNSSSNQPSILVLLDADNPVDYGGLNPKLVYTSTYFVSNNFSLFQSVPLQRGWIPSQNLSPHALTVWNFNITLTPPDAKSLSNFYMSHKGNITSVVFIEVTVSSLLDEVSGAPTFYQGQQNVTLV